MSVNVKEAIERAQRIVQDDEAVRWTLPEWLTWFNDAIREIALYKPTAFSVSAPFLLAAGTYQKAPAAANLVLRVTRNLKTIDPDTRVGTTSVRAVDRDQLDLSNPSWHDPTVVTPRREVRNVAYDQDEPTAFWVYPPNDGTGIVELVTSVPPEPIAAPDAPNEIASYETLEAKAPNVLLNAVTDYMLYRAFSKDAAFAGSAQRAITYYSAFANAVGINIQNAKSLNPNTKPTMQEENRA